jgi:3-keto-disaccharide hydrolase
MKFFLIIWLIMPGFCVNAQETIVNMKPLFNGKNLNGWYTFLKLEGKNNDPEKIFSVENGLLHISGKEFGYMCTQKTFAIIFQKKQKIPFGPGQLNARYRKVMSEISG